MYMHIHTLELFQNIKEQKSKCHMFVDVKFYRPPFTLVFPREFVHTLVVKKVVVILSKPLSFNL